MQYADEISYRADGNSDKGVAFCSVNPWIGILKNRLGALPLDEPRFARATVYSNRELDVSIRINPDPPHYGLHFFKYYDSAAWFLAGRVARLSMAVPGYLRHPVEDSKEAWILTKRDRETFMQVLKSKSQKYRSIPFGRRLSSTTTTKSFTWIGRKCLVASCETRLLSRWHTLMRASSLMP